MKSLSGILGDTFVGRWYEDHSFQMLATNNFVAVFFMFCFVGVLVSFLYRNRGKLNQDLRWMTIGAIIEQSGWIIHRGFYGVINAYKVAGDIDTVKYLYGNMEIIPVFAGFVILAGLMLILAPAISYVRSGKNRLTSYFAAFGIIFVVWWFAFLTVDKDHALFSLKWDPKTVEQMTGTEPRLQTQENLIDLDP